MSNPPDTLIGLGPPEPPQKYGDDARDAPETFRAWSSSSSDIQPQEALEEPSIPVETLFRSAFRESRSAFGVSRRSSQLWWAAAAVSVVLAGACVWVAVRQRPAPRLAPVTAVRAPSTTRVVGGPWVLSPGTEPTPEHASNLDAEADMDPDAAHIPFREPGTKHHHHGAPAATRVAPKEAPTAVTPDPSRIEAVAGTVELEEESSVGAMPDEAANPSTAE